jgi:molybdate transport system permease protein
MEWHPLILSLQIASTATVLAAVLGILLAWLFAARRFWGRELLDVIFTAPMVLPPTVLGYYVLVAVGKRSFIGQAWFALTGTHIVFTRTGAVLAAALSALPLVIKSARAALVSVDPTLSQAARTLGAGPLRTFLVVQLRLAGPGIIAGVMLAYARALGDFGLTLMVAGDIPGVTRTAPLAIYDAIQAHRQAEALGMVLTLTAVAIFTLYLVNKLTGKRDVYSGNA